MKTLLKCFAFAFNNVSELDKLWKGYPPYINCISRKCFVYFAQNVTVFEFGYANP